MNIRFKIFNNHDRTNYFANDLFNSCFFFFLNISELNEIDNNYVELYNPKEVDEDFNSSTPLFLNSVKYLFK